MKNISINLKLFAFKYWLAKKLNASIEEDKQAIKDGAKITKQNYCKLQLIECERLTYDKNELEALAKKYNLKKKSTKYIRIDIDNIPIETQEKVNNLLQSIQDTTTDNTTKRVACKVANAK